MSRNRHGIQTYVSTFTRCCWPKCQLPVRRWTDLNLCDHHVTVVAERVARAEIDEERVRAQKAWAEAETSRVCHERTLHAGDLDQPAPDPARGGVVYYVKVGGHIKIGWTSDLDKRMRSYPPGSELLAVHPGTRADEAQLHRRFAVHRSHGREWYPLAPVILDHVKRMVAQHGAPADQTFGAKPVDVPQPRPKERHRTGVGPRNVA